MAEWDREFSVDPEAVRRAVGAPERWRLLGTGWDCDAWLADECVVWRVPRRQVGIDALRREAGAMPILAPRLPAQVPVATLVEIEGLPPLARHALVPGRELPEVDEVRASFGAALGRFLRALHDPALVREAGANLRADPMGRGDPTRRVPFTHRRLEEIEAQFDVAPLRPIVDAANGPALAPDAVCHADLHLRHVVVDAGGELSGVIDWGDCCVGARAMDLAIVTALGPSVRAAFFDAYDPVSDAVWRHARMLGVMFGASLLAADPEGRSGRAGRRWLERLASGDAAA